MPGVIFNPNIKNINLNRIFGEFPSGMENCCGNYPSVDIVENDNSFELFAELPGVKKEDVKIVVEDGVLQISGEKKSNIIENEKSKITRNERSFGKFERKFKLTEDINPDEIKANFENGLLKITFAKIVPEKPKEIMIDVK